MAPGRPDNIDFGLLAAVWVLVDEPGQIAALDLPNACGYCPVAPNGAVQCYQKNLNRATLSQWISSILDDIHRLSNALYAMNTTDIQGYPDNYETLSTDAALRAGQIACRLRHILYASTNIQKSANKKSRENLQEG